MLEARKQKGKFRVWAAGQRAKGLGQRGAFGCLRLEAKKFKAQS
jgi:hypothetical protein